MPFGVKRTMPAKYDSSLPRWFPFLTKARGEGNALLEKETLRDNSNLGVCLQAVVGRAQFDADGKPRPVRMFAVFETFEHFFAWMSRDVPVALRCAYEIIRESALQKPYFDIDLAISSIPPNVTQSDIESSIAEIASVASSVADVTTASSLVFSSSSPTKFSFHIVVNGVSLPSNAASQVYCKAVIREISRSRPQIAQCVVDAIDTKVYSKIQQFRILGNRKFGENDSRVKTYRPELSEWHPTPGGQIDFKIFCASLVTCFSTSGSPPSQHSVFSQCIDEAPPKSKRAFVFTGECISIEEAERFLDLVKQRLESMGTTSPFSIREGDSSIVAGEGGVIVHLNRNAPSFCLLCARKHENEHPFLIVIPGVSVSMKCRRGGGTAVKIDLSKKIPLTEGALVKYMIASRAQSSRTSTVESASEPVAQSQTVKTSQTVSDPPRVGILFGAPKSRREVHGITKDAAYAPFRGMSHAEFEAEMATLII